VLIVEVRVVVVEVDLVTAPDRAVSVSVTVS
jgi:hypothetical protein